jgi:hypothetical protein
MGRRSKAVELGVEGEIVQLHDRDLLSHSEISDKLKGRGADLSREAVRRSYVASRRKAEKYKVAAESARTVLESVKDGTNTDLVEAGNSILVNMFYAKILDMEDIEFAKPKDFFDSMAKVSHNQVELSKHRLNFQNGVERAKAKVYDELAAQLAADYPDLLEKLQGVIMKLEVRP